MWPKHHPSHRAAFKFGLQGGAYLCSQFTAAHNSQSWSQIVQALNPFLVRMTYTSVCLHIKCAGASLITFSPVVRVLSQDVLSFAMSDFFCGSRP